MTATLYRPHRSKGRCLDAWWPATWTARAKGPPSQGRDTTRRRNDSGQLKGMIQEGPSKRPHATRQRPSHASSQRPLPLTSNTDSISRSLGGVSTSLLGRWRVLSGQEDSHILAEHRVVQISHRGSCIMQKWVERPTIPTCPTLSVNPATTATLADCSPRRRSLPSKLAGRRPVRLVPRRPSAAVGSPATAMGSSGRLSRKRQRPPLGS